jgi:putative transposase
VIYGFVEAEKANHPVSMMCRTLKVSKSGYYGWQERLPSARAKADAALSHQIERIHKDSRGTYTVLRGSTSSWVP